MPGGAARGQRVLGRTLAALAGIVLTLLAPRALARVEEPAGSGPTLPVLPIGQGGSTTTEPPSTSTDTAAPGSDGSASDASSDGSSLGPLEGGDGGLSPLGGGPGQVVPPDAAALISSLQRSAPGDDTALVEGERKLLAAGVAPDEAARTAYGQFPVAGPATWRDDWLDPRFDGTEFRYHYGIDIQAPLGTPLRSPADGRVATGVTPACGLGLTITLVDGTFFELCHLSALAPDLAPGDVVHVGDPVGLVGNTGDATGPHLHLGLWEHGTTPSSPKPLIDGWASDAARNLAARFAPPPSQRSMLGAALAREVADGEPGTAGGGASTDLLLVSAGSPAGGAVQVAKATAARMAGEVDWSRRAADAASRASVGDLAWRVLDPLLPEILRGP